MLRFLCLSLLIALAGPLAAQPRPPMPQHQQAADAVWEVMDLDSRWLDRVGAIHHPGRIRALFLSGMAAAMPGADPAEVRAGLEFYRTGFGQRMLALESSARVAMLDADVEAAAREAFARASFQEAPRAAQILRLIEAADLIESNVAGGMNASIAFSRGFQAGGGFPMPMSEGEIIQEAWAQEPQMRADTEDWIGAYLFLAYSSLSDAELDGYIAYAGSPEGQALSRLMFAGFDAVFAQTSHDMGLAAAAEIRGRQL